MIPNGLPPNFAKTWRVGRVEKPDGAVNSAGGVVSKVRLVSNMCLGEFAFEEGVAVVVSERKATKDQPVEKQARITNTRAISRAPPWRRATPRGPSACLPVGQ